MEIIQIIMLVFLLGCIVFSQIYDDKITVIIKSKGITVHPVIMFPWYFSIFNDIIKQEMNAELKKKYRFILFINLITKVIFYIGGIILILLDI